MYYLQGGKHVISVVGLTTLYINIEKKEIVIIERTERWLPTDRLYRATHPI